MPTATPTKPKKIKLPALAVKEFRKLSKNERRIAVAEDVLLQLNNQLLVPSCGSYVHMPDPDFDLAAATTEDYNDAYDAAYRQHLDSDARTFLLSNKFKPQSCECCAIGAGVVAAVRLNNQFTVRQTDNDTTSITAVYKLFGRDAVLMEMAFEQGSGSNQICAGYESKWEWETIYNEDGYVASRPSVANALAAMNLWPGVDTSERSRKGPGYGRIRDGHLRSAVVEYERMRLVWTTILRAEGRFDLDVAKRLRPRKAKYYTSRRKKGLMHFG